MSRYRRRPIRPGGRAWQRRIAPPVAHGVLRRINQAHALNAEGQHRQAAILFEELALDAPRQDIRRAPQFAIQAGMAWLAAGENERALDRFRRALGAIRRHAQPRRYQSASQRVFERLRQHGLTAEAAALEAELERQPFEPAQAGEPPSAPAARRLPGKCASCGSTLRSDEVEWIDDDSAACDYCGSVIEAGGSSD